MLHMPKFWANSTFRHFMFPPIDYDIWEDGSRTNSWELVCAKVYNWQCLSNFIFCWYSWDFLANILSVAVLKKDSYYHHSFMNYWLWETSVSRERWWWEYSPPLHFARVRFKDWAPFYGLILLVLFSVPRRFQFPRVLQFLPPLLKNLHAIKISFVHDPTSSEL